MATGSILDNLFETAPTLSVGILAGNLMALGSELESLEHTPLRLLHIDVMDGCFVPQMTVGPGFVKAIRSPLLKDVHLMIREPLEKIPEYVGAGADMITIHCESCTHVHRALQSMRGLVNANDSARGVLRGLALNPGTSLAGVDHVMDEIDFLLLLAVNPGWGGQSFIGSTLTKIKRAQEVIRASGRRILLGVDGGVTRTNLSRIAATGVDVVVAGSAVFDGNTPAQNATSMLEVLKGTAAESVREPGPSISSRS